MQYDISAKDGPISLRPLEQSDAPLLLRWLTDPRNLEYWEGPHEIFTPERIQEDFYTEEWNGSACIIGYEGRDIGYVQAYQLDEEMFGEYQYHRTDLKTFGIDQFIGEPELWGKGIGRKFISLICGYLKNNCGAQAIVLDPHADNPRALRCYEACGFKKVKLLPAHELHDGKRVDCWLMALEFTDFGT